MRRLSTLAPLVLLLAGSSIALLAQDSDEISIVRSAVVQHNVNLRRDPSTRHAPLALLPVSTELQLLEPTPRSGFYHVITKDGRQGWTVAKNVQLGPAPPEMFEAQAAQACVASFDLCTPIGCGKEGSTQALVNQAKRRLPTETEATFLSFTDMKALQDQANNLVGQHVELDAEGRAKLANLAVTDGTVAEGSLVQLSGFISTGAKPHPNTGESVNCKFTQAANNDYHINIAPKPTDTELAGTVVEMVPWGRPEGWPLKKLLDAQKQKLRVLVEGGLFYDNLHFVNADPNHVLGGQPKRFALWEIHPITGFFVCSKKDGSCDPGNPDDNWTPLEDFEAQ
ncbi:MAG TPA: hypothetical protein VFE33_11755 [Thermoanaerobaculia bacterium]|nr:hypothetical protein [Thermoanaerobaculia bacterium]